MARITAIKIGDIGSDTYLDQMFQLRARVFCERLGWNVTITNGRERDAFDDLRPAYVIAFDEEDNVVACTRLLPASGPMMVTTVFSKLLGNHALTRECRMVESSRFCVDTAACRPGNGTIHEITRCMFAGIVEWCVINGFGEIVTATDVMVERILKRAGWPLDRLGDPCLVGQTLAVAGILPATQEIFERLRPPGYISEFTPPMTLRARVRT
ncbi:Acyl-homoserine-lactone synthase [Ensifer adhaerens]|uniref:acyl-homoserine-lactone synthase n=1 Tax=Ensifer adhaerens TaxID=106592 RepID=UPI0031F36A2D|nr:Acyl-homoserine-lactone synthase [Ensifer adhaerens]